MTDVDRPYTTSPLVFFRVEIEKMTGSSALNYNKALTCLRAFVSPTASFADIGTTKFLEDWFVFMHFRGLTTKTCLHYFDILAGLYSKAIAYGLAKETNVFVTVKARIKLLTANNLRQTVSEESFTRLLQVTKYANNQIGETAISTDILLLSLLNKGMSIVNVARLQRNSMSEYDNECRAIAERHIDKRRKYVFPLKQISKTPKQLSLLVSNMIANLFNDNNIQYTENIQDSIRSYWAYAALRCGIAATAVIATLGYRPAGIPILGIVSKNSGITEDDKLAIVRTVGNLFLNNPLNWYAMRLRRKVKYEQIADCIKNIENRSQLELFYPCEEIARRVKKKIVYEEKPILADIVFFKSRVTDIQPLFRKIGGMAWCYTFGGSYASISKNAMEHFQRAISKFTPDYEVGPINSLKLHTGDKVVVLGGLFMGYDGEITKETSDESGIIYRIKIQNAPAMNIEWRANVPRMLKKR